MAKKKQVTKPETMCDLCAKDPSTCESLSAEMDETFEVVVSCQDYEQKPREATPEPKVDKVAPKVAPSVMAVKNCVVRGNVLKAPSIAGNLYNVNGINDGTWAALKGVEYIDFINNVAKFSDGEIKLM